MKITQCSEKSAIRREIYATLGDAYCEAGTRAHGGRLVIECRLSTLFGSSTLQPLSHLHSMIFHAFRRTFSERFNTIQPCYRSVMW